jgi:hypothetical protein
VWIDSCAAFQLGSTNSNGCASPRYVRLETEDTCKSLAAIAGQEYDVVHDVMEECSYYPAGCFRHTVTGKFYWNPHGSGANNSFAQPLCAGAPHHARRRTAGNVGKWLCGMPHHVVLA